MKLTLAPRRILEFIASGKDGRTEAQVLASGGRAASQLRALFAARYVDYVIPPPGSLRSETVRVAATAAGRAALERKP